MKNSVLVIAAHPDDEVLGCGGTIARLSAEGKSVSVVFLADGVTSREQNEVPNQHKISTRHISANNACKIIGAQISGFGDFPDNQFDKIPMLKIIKYVETMIEKHSPDTIFTHSACDLNIDHKIANQAVVTACRPQKGYPVKTILFFETPSSTEWQVPGFVNLFAPNWFVDITDTINLKLKALRAYKDELKSWPHPRSIQGVDHLTRWRGATIGVEAAEAFMLGRNII